jgi:hypothetical protein
VADLQLGDEALLVASTDEDHDVIDGLIGGFADLIGRLAKTGGDWICHLLDRLGLLRVEGWLMERVMCCSAHFSTSYTKW